MKLIFALLLATPLSLHAQLQNVEQMTAPNLADKYPSLVFDRSGTLWLAWTSTRGGHDVILTKSKRAGQWSAEQRMDGGSGIESRPRLALDAAGNVRLVWHGQRAGKWRLYARTYDGRSWSPEQALTPASIDALHPVLELDDAGTLWLAWQVATRSGFQIQLASLLKRGVTPAATIASAGLDVRPALARRNGNGVWIAWSSTRSGNYDIFLASAKARGAHAPVISAHRQITHDPEFDDAPSLATLPDGDLWIAWTSMRSHPNALTLAERRSGDAFVRVLRKDELFAPMPPVQGAMPGQVSYGAVDKSARDAESLEWHWKQTQNYPIVASDSAGRVYVIWRTDATGAHNFDLWARVYDHGVWSEELHLTGFSPGRDEWPAVAIAPGGSLQLAWEGQTVPPPGEEDKYKGGDVDSYNTLGQPNVVLTALFEPPARGTRSAALVPLQKTSGPEAPAALGTHSTPKVANYNVYFGDLHSHSIYSDAKVGLPDELFWLARDVEQLDFFALTDHAEMGLLQPSEYAENILTARQFDLPDQFVAMIGWEWTANFAFGHRIALPASDTIKPLSWVAPSGRTVEQLYAHLRGTGSVVSPHHTAQAVWGRWNPAAPYDSTIEPLFEINSWHGRFEYYGNPHEGRRQVPGHHYQDALALGHRVGALGSSDAHFLNVANGGLTGVLAERLDRAAIFEALRARRTYATTGAKIVLAVTANGAPMGSQLESADSVVIGIDVQGTNVIDRVDVLRSNKTMWSLVRTQADASGQGATYMVYDAATPQAAKVVKREDARRVTAEFTDSAPEKSGWYYVRVTQTDGHQAWSSPVWIGSPGS